DSTLFTLPHPTPRPAAQGTSVGRPARHGSSCGLPWSATNSTSRPSPTTAWLCAASRDVRGLGFLCHPAARGCGAPGVPAIPGAGHRAPRPPGEPLPSSLAGSCPVTITTSPRSLLELSDERDTALQLRLAAYR